MRGQYHSAPAMNQDGYALDALGSDLLAVASTISQDGGRLHLLGHSFGGLVARHATLASPSVFASLTLLCSGPGTIGGDRAQVLSDLLDFLEPAGADIKMLSALIDQVWHGQLKPQALADGTPAEIIDFLAERAALSCPLGLAEMARHLLNCPDRTTELAALEELPKLVSYGENDDAWPPEVQDLMAKRLGAERICIPGAAHSPAVEAPETTAAMLTAFWNQAESRPRR
jgi:pimeloyl-ACP methyl ester carboxylesterase